MYKLYQLTFTDGFNYVGTTKRTLTRRINFHRNNTKPANRGVTYRIKNDMLVGKQILATSNSHKQILQLERETLLKYSKQGVKLLNCYLETSDKTRRRLSSKPVGIGRTYHCFICDLWLPREAFHKSKTSYRKSGTTSYCKECWSITRALCGCHWSGRRDKNGQRVYVRSIPFPAVRDIVKDLSLSIKR